MKKGLNVTLMTVALAMLCVQAMALAPVISDIQSPVIGNEGVTGSNTYIFPDALSLDANVSDDATADADILWSYTIVGTPIYRINNVNTITVGTDNINAPGAKRMDTTTDPADGDSNGNTITIRNIKYTPVSGSTVAPTGSGVIDSQVVTLFASDGTTYSSKNVLFYTEVGGSDHFGYSPSTGTEIPLPALPTSWSYNTGLTVGSVTSSIVSNGLCMEVATTGGNFNINGWYSTFGYIQLVQNAVYKFRFRVNGNQASGVTAPFWDIVINNFDGTNGLNLYGADYFFLDNEDGDGNPAVLGHGANYPSTSGTDFFVWWCPNAVSTSQWNNSTNGVFATSVGNNRNMYLQFRVLDVNGNGGITADLDGGRICMTQIQATRYDLGSMQDQGSAYTNTNLTSTNFNSTALLGSTVTYGGTSGSQYCTYANTSGSQAAEFIVAFPGDANVNFGTPSTLTDNYPIPWESDKLYQITVELSAPTTTDETHPYDVFWVGMDTATNEVINESYVTYKQNFCAMPKSGTPQVYRAFFWSHKLSLTTVAEYKRLRPTFKMGNATGMTDMVNSSGQIVPPGTSGASAMNSGALRLHNMKVNKVQF